MTGSDSNMLLGSAVGPSGWTPGRPDPVRSGTGRRTIPP